MRCSFTDDTELTLEELEETVATINTEPVFEDDSQNYAKSKELFSLANQLCDRVADLDPIIERGWDLKEAAKIYWSLIKNLANEQRKRRKKLSTDFFPTFLNVRSII